MTIFETLDQANERLRKVRAILEVLEARRGEFVGLGDWLHAAVAILRRTIA